MPFTQLLSISGGRKRIRKEIQTNAVLVNHLRQALRLIVKLRGVEPSSSNAQETDLPGRCLSGRYRAPIYA